LDLDHARHEVTIDLPIASTSTRAALPRGILAPIAAARHSARSITRRDRDATVRAGRSRGARITRPAIAVAMTRQVGEPRL